MRYYRKENSCELPQINKNLFNKTYKSLMDLIGLDEAKEIAQKFFNYVKINNLRRERNLTALSSCFNMAFIGEPGTGKTSVARYYARIFKSLGILSKGHLVEVSRSDLIGQKIGQTEKKTEDIFMSALDGVLFIDEAHTLYQPHCDVDYGNECLGTLVKLMEDYRDRVVIIFAGYKVEMKNTLFQYKGLESRVPYIVDFKNYTAEELSEIFIHMLKDKDYFLQNGTNRALVQTISKVKNSSNKVFNARNIRNMVEKTLINQTQRLAQMDFIKDEELTKIYISDLDLPYNYKEDNVVFLKVEKGTT